MGKSLHAHDEDVRGHRVSLSDSTRMVESLCKSTIEKDLNRVGGDIRHDEFVQHFGDVKILKSLLNE